jgi:two-component system sensor histidine kinase MprB
MPLRNRLTAAAAAAAAVAIVGVVSVSYVAVRHELLHNVDSQLRHQAGEIFPVPGFGRVNINNSVGDIGGCLQVIDTIGVISKPQTACPVLPVDVPDFHIAQTGTGQLIRTVAVDGHPYRMLTERMPSTSTVSGQGKAVQLVVPLSSVDHQLGTLRAFFLFATLAGLAIVAGGTWLVVRRTMRPVRALTDAAEQIAVTRDLTTRIDDFDDDELGRLASSFNAMLDALERSLGQQRQLVLDASHELRTPLASLRTNAELLNQIDEMSPEQRRATLDGIVVQLDELTGLVADVVELARGEAPPAAHEDVAFDELVTSAVERSRRHWRTVQFSLRTEPVVVRGVAARLDRAVANLLDNAGKFSSPGASVDVSVSANGELLVADRGPGIPPAALPFVFDRFFRADVARGLPGSGLGLSIVKQIVDGVGGTVELGARAGGGTIARIRLPVEGPEPGATGRETAEVGAAV